MIKIIGDKPLIKHVKHFKPPAKKYNVLQLVRNKPNKFIIKSVDWVIISNTRIKAFKIEIGTGDRRNLLTQKLD